MKKKNRERGYEPILKVIPKKGGRVGKDEWKFRITIPAPINYINNFVGSTFIVNRIDTRRLEDAITYEYDIHIMPLPESNPWSGVYKSVMRVTDEIEFMNRVNKLAKRKKPAKRKAKK